jgi:hypothetical protein
LIHEKTLVSVEKKEDRADAVDGGREDAVKSK